MVGIGSGTGLALYGTTTSANAWLQDVMVGSAAEMGLDLDVAAMAPSGASDHAPFAAVGVPAVMATTLGSHPTYHSPEDTVETITVDDLGAAAALMYAGLLPLVEGTEEAYLADGKGYPASQNPDAIDLRERLVRGR
jgi:aminopeptidase-like protein